MIKSSNWSPIKNTEIYLIIENKKYQFDPQESQKLVKIISNKDQNIPKNHLKKN